MKKQRFWGACSSAPAPCEMLSQLIGRPPRVTMGVRLLQATRASPIGYMTGGALEERPGREGDGIIQFRYQCWIPAW